MKSQASVISEARSLKNNDSIYSLFANIPEMPIFGAQQLTDDKKSQSSFSGISRDLLHGYKGVESVSRLSDGGISEKEIQVGVKTKSESPTKVNTRKKPKF